MKIIVMCCFINFILLKIYGREQWNMNEKQRQVRSCTFYKKILPNSSICYDVFKESRVAGPAWLIQNKNSFLNTALRISKWYSDYKEKKFNGLKEMLITFYKKRGLDFTQKPNAGEMKVTLSNKHKINTKWIYLGASLTVFCVAVAVAVGVILLDRKNSKDKEDHIQPYEKVGLNTDYIQPYEEPRLSTDNVISEVHESGLLSTSYTLTN